MAGITDAAFRLMTRKNGCEMAITEMISAEGLVRHNAKTRKLIELHPGERPAGVQIFGADADVLGRAAAIVEESGADLVDINMGCPAKKVTRIGAGSALMEKPRHAARVVKKVRKGTNLPLTVKIRAGWNGAINFLEVGKLAENEGADAIILHPRTVEQAFTGTSNWDLIRELKSSLKIPVIGNGDIRSADDAQRMLALTGCDGVMVGRGALGSPWIFRSIKEKMMGDDENHGAPSLEEKKNLALDHLRTAIVIFGEPAGLRLVRPHLAWYARGLRGAAVFRNSIAGLQNARDMEERIESFFSGREKSII
jgi:nifR3 family TIM-barrel protein